MSGLPPSSRIRPSSSTSEVRSNPTSSHPQVQSSGPSEPFESTGPSTHSPGRSHSHGDEDIYSDAYQRSVLGAERPSTSAQPKNQPPLPSLSKKEKSTTSSQSPASSFNIEDFTSSQIDNASGSSVTTLPPEDLSRDINTSHDGKFELGSLEEAYLQKSLLLDDPSISNLYLHKFFNPSDLKPIDSDTNRVKEAISVASHLYASSSGTIAETLCQALNQLTSKEFWQDANNFSDLKSEETRIELSKMCIESKAVISGLVNTIQDYSQTRNFTFNIFYHHKHCTASSLSPGERARSVFFCQELLDYLVIHLRHQLHKNSTILVPVDFIPLNYSPGHVTILNISKNYKNNDERISISWFNPNGHEGTYYVTADSAGVHLNETKSTLVSQSADISIVHKFNPKDNQSFLDNIKLPMELINDVHYNEQDKPSTSGQNPAGESSTTIFNNEVLNFLLCPSLESPNDSLEALFNTADDLLRSAGVNQAADPQRIQAPQKTGDCEKKCMLSFLSHRLPEPIYQAARSLMIKKAVESSSDDQTTLWQKSDIQFTAEQVNQLLPILPKHLRAGL